MSALRLLADVTKRTYVAPAVAQRGDHSKKDLVTELKKIYGLSAAPVHAIYDA